MAYEKLQNTEISERLKSLDGWTLAPDGLLIEKPFRFDNFRSAFAFMTECALMAEKLDHHPDWTNVYSSVTVRLSTHSAGGLTELDFKLAAAMDKAAKKAGHRSRD
jgi:4a-hydroxytetrahydrobiopterin dehydratase